MAGLRNRFVANPHNEGELAGAERCQHERVIAVLFVGRFFDDAGTIWLRVCAVVLESRFILAIH
jgi:hypothetical protein